MLRFLADENFNADIVRGVLLRGAAVEIVQVLDADLASADDPTVLAWAAENDRIVLTHDRNTMTDFAIQRLRDGHDLPGLFVVNDQCPVGQVIQELVLIAGCSQHQEWRNQLLYLPL